MFFSLEVKHKKKEIERDGKDGSRPENQVKLCIFDAGLQMLALCFFSFVFFAFSGLVLFHLLWFCVS